MKTPPTPPLETRDAPALARELSSRAAAYVPAWRPAPSGPGWAVLQAFCRYAETLADRLNQAPDKNKLAFLDLLGIDLLPPQAARAPVAFQPIAGAGDGRIPERTRVGASVPGRGEPLVFETETAIALVGARLAEVASVWPERDACADHTADVIAGRAFTLFEPLQPVPHVLYLGHGRLLALTAQARLDVEIELAVASAEPLRVAWEYWDGQIWRLFAEPVADGTAGFTRSGTTRLSAACGRTVPTKVDGVETCWIRGRLVDPLPPDPGRRLPEVAAVRLRTVIERPLRYVVKQFLATCVGDLQPDQAFADGIKLDLTKPFFPFGRAPERGSAFYFASDEVLTKPGARVSVCFRRVITPAQEADDLEAQFTPALDAAVGHVVDGARHAGQALADAIQAYLALLDASDEKDALVARLEAFTTALAALAQPSEIDALVGLAQEVVEDLPDLPSGIFDVLDDHHDDILASGAEIAQAGAAARAALDALSQLTPLDAGAVGGVASPQMTPPRLVWEYWSGEAWKTLIAASADAKTSFLQSGEVTFVVPDDVAEIEVSGVTGRWVRVRLASGSFDRLRLVSWFDTQAEKINFVPILEPRPPALEGFFLGYSYRSAQESPERCLAYNDFRYEDRTEEAAWPGPTFQPFRAMADLTPALYLGFDGPLPADLVSLYLDVEEVEDDTAGPPLVWEYRDGDEWRAWAVRDETRHLALPGIVSGAWPGVAAPVSASVLSATGDVVQLLEPHQTARFSPGDRVYVAGDRGGELATVARAGAGTVRLTAPLAQDYVRATLSVARLPRFGTPRTWIRARLRDPGAPRKARVRGIHPNAVWAAQLQTVENEVLGESTGEPIQTLFVRQTPVLPGEVIEVRERRGASAALDLPLLAKEVVDAGGSEEDLRPVTDRRTGETGEVWVRWHVRPNLFFSGPDARAGTLERTRGRLRLGDGVYGGVPRAGSELRARLYRTGGGVAGNVAAGAVGQLLSGVAAQGVTNPRAGEGGADGESLESVRTRGPQAVRHRRQAISAGDYEALAREASPAVALARALPATHRSGRPAAGWVRLVIVPQSQAPRPQPSYELRRRVADFLARRTPAAMAGLAVLGPEYLPVGVTAVVAPRHAAEAGPVRERVLAALARFLHPLAGGPEAAGWAFGRDLCLSDVAALLEGLPGVDHLEILELLTDGVPRGEVVPVATDRIVAAGPFDVRLAGGG